MILRWRDYEIDLGELGWRLRADRRYLLAAALTGLLLLCACGWLFYPRSRPTATVYLVGPVGLTVTVGQETLAGAGPHTLPAGPLTAHVEANGYYPQDLALTLTPHTTTTLTATLFPRPAFQKIRADLPGAAVEAAWLTPSGVRFATVVTATEEPQQTVQWWEMAPDGRREHLLALEAGPAARRERDGALAYLRPEGLFLGEGRLLITATANVSALAWWGDELLLFRALPTGIQVDRLDPTMGAPAGQSLAVLPSLPDSRYVLASPAGGFVVLAFPGPASTSLVVLDGSGRAGYLADLPAQPLPWAFLTWESEGVLLWTAPRVQPKGAITWPIYRLDLVAEQSTLLARPAEVHGLWVEGADVYYLDEQARVTSVQGEALYTIQEIAAQGEFSLWRQGGRALLWTMPPRAPVSATPRGGGQPTTTVSRSDAYWLLSWPEGGTP